MIGNEPWAPVPMINRGPPHGSSSSAESGVCPNLSRYGFEGFLLRLRTAPRSMTMSCSYVRPSTSIDPNPRSRTSITCRRTRPSGSPTLRNLRLLSVRGSRCARRRWARWATTVVLVAKGRFQAFVDDARLFGRDWGLRLTDVKASVLADQSMRRLPARCLAQVGSMQLQARQALPHASSTRARAQARRQGRRRDLSPGRHYVRQVRQGQRHPGTSDPHSRLSYLTGWSLGGSRVEPSRRTTGPTGADTPVGGGGVGLGSGGLSGGAG